MPSSQFTSVWDALSPDLRARLVEHPSRSLSAEHVDELVLAGGRHAHAVWWDSRPGHPRQWATSWQFRRFIEHHRDTDGAMRLGDRFGFGGFRVRGRLPLMPG